MNERVEGVGGQPELTQGLDKKELENHLNDVEDCGYGWKIEVSVLIDKVVKDAKTDLQARYNKYAPAIEDAKKAGESSAVVENIIKMAKVNFEDEVKRIKTSMKSEVLKLLSN